MVGLFVIISLKGEKLQLPPPIGALLGISFYQVQLYIQVVRPSQRTRVFFGLCTKMGDVSERKTCRPTTKGKVGGVRNGRGREWENGGEIGRRMRGYNQY